MPPNRSGRGHGRGRGRGHGSGRRGGHESGEGRFRSLCLEDKKHEAKPASRQTVQETSLSASRTEAVTQLWQPSGRCLTLSLGSRVWERLRHDWGRSFCIRLDLQGHFHTYPDVGGPFQSLQEADEAINRYLECRRDPKMCMEKDGRFSVERLVRQSLYWPDGTIRKRTRSYLIEEANNRMFKIVQALVDKYNEDHNLLKDAAHELKDVLHCQSICENQSWYYHLNFTTKIKGVGPNNCSGGNLFFAEVKCMPQGEHTELLVSCFCTVNPNDKGLHCYGCTNHDNDGMKHPDSSVECIAGHLDVHLPVGCFAEWSDFDGDDDKYVKARETELRKMYKGLDKPGAFKKLFTLPPGVTIVDD